MGIHIVYVTHMTMSTNERWPIPLLICPKYNSQLLCLPHILILVFTLSPHTHLSYSIIIIGLYHVLLLEQEWKCVFLWSIWLFSSFFCNFAYLRHSAYIALRCTFFFLYFVKHTHHTGKLLNILRIKVF